MRIHPQIVTKNSLPEFVILPYEEYEKLITLLEDQEDIEGAKEFSQNNEETIPFEILRNIANRKNAIRQFRELRGMSASELARKIGVSRQYINQLEKGSSKGKGSAIVLKKIASALNISIELLI